MSDANEKIVGSTSSPQVNAEASDATLDRLAKMCVTSEELPVGQCGPTTADITGKEGETEDMEEGFTEQETDLVEARLNALAETWTKEETQAEREKAQQFKEEGNNAFKLVSSASACNEDVSSGEDALCSALRLYSTAIGTCPMEFKEDRAVLYHNRALTKIRLNREKDAVTDLNKAIELNANYVKARLRLAKLNEELGNLDEAFSEFKDLLQVDPGNHEVRAAVMRLPPLIEERNEKLKTEMLSKGKDLLNTLLRPLGLSTDNFKMTQNPGGGYNISM